MNLLHLDIDFLIVDWISNLGHNAMIPFIIKILVVNGTCLISWSQNCAKILKKSTDSDQNLNNLEGDQDTSAGQISGHYSKVFSTKCLEFPNLTCFTQNCLIQNCAKIRNINRTWPPKNGGITTRLTEKRNNENKRLKLILRLAGSTRSMQG